MPPLTPPPSHTTRPELRGTFGMTASTHWLATASAQSVLERGGTAVDAAVAGAFVLHVVEPHLNGPGGDLTALIAVAGEDPVVISGQGAAPAGATIEHYRAEGLQEVPGAGLLAATAPGAVPAWLDLLEHRGTWELADVLAPALGYARDGHPVLPAVVDAIERSRALFETDWPTSAEQWLSPERLPAAGGLATNRPYARTLERLLAAGTDAGDREGRIRAARDAWRHGFVAEAIDEFARVPSRHSTGGIHAGVITSTDAAAIVAREEEPVRLDFRGVTVSKAGPWTQGPILLQALAILDHLPDERLDPATAEGMHSIAEALKLALADRDAWYGDPDRTAVPLADLLDPDYARERAALIGPAASREFRPGCPGGRAPWLPPLAEGEAGTGLASPDARATGATGRPPHLAAGAGEPTFGAGGVGAARSSVDSPAIDDDDRDDPTTGGEAVRDDLTLDPRTGAPRGDTCHIDVIDQWGTAIAATPSGGWLQSSPTIPELGFCLGTRLQMTWLDPASPSALAPGIRPRSTLSPTMVSSDGRVIEALGTPGGDQQDQWQLVYLIRRLIGGWSPQAAIDAPMFHTTSHVGSFEPRTWTPGGLVVEKRVGADVVAELRARGHVVTVAGAWALGRISTVGRHPDGGYFAAANPRGGQGYASGR